MIFNDWFFFVSLHFYEWLIYNIEILKTSQRKNKEIKRAEKKILKKCTELQQWLNIYII